VRIRTIAVIAGIIVGIAAGLGAYTFIYAKGYSYLTNDPAACANCHSMNEQYAGWMKGPHRSVAVCNDCHTPHNLIGKYTVKASNGFWHSFYFTSGWYPDNIEITKRDRAITDRACRHCHADITHAIDTELTGREEDKLSCIRCHADVGHM
jgi:cytochrome c nitrite reductase small subunit